MCSALCAAEVRAAGRCEDTVALDVKTIAVDGVAGNWFAPDAMNRIYFVLSECVPRYRAVITAQDRLIATQARAIETSSRAVTASDELALRWREAYVTEREAHTGVFRSPVFWFVVGVGLGAAAVIGGAVALGSVNPR